jgi:hypothetical protein
MKRHGVLFSGLLNFFPIFHIYDSGLCCIFFPCTVILVDYFLCSPTV